MDNTNLRGISRTAPYFHNNSAATLEEVVHHYIAFFTRVARLNPPPNLPPILSSTGIVVDRGFVAADERAALLAYLRKALVCGIGVRRSASPAMTIVGVVTLAA